AVGDITLADPGLPGSRDTFTGSIRGRSVTEVPVVGRFDAPEALVDMSDGIMNNLHAFNLVNRGSPNFRDANTEIQHGITAQLNAATAILNDFTLDPVVQDQIRQLIARSSNLDFTALNTVNT